MQCTVFELISQEVDINGDTHRIFDERCFLNNIGLGSLLHEHVLLYLNKFKSPESYNTVSWHYNQSSDSESEHDLLN